ncbi:hypothetical protein HKBW3S06_01686, partial [Candidatus Hakubella thermalkaliphila]
TLKIERHLKVSYNPKDKQVRKSLEKEANRCLTSRSLNGDLMVCSILSTLCLRSSKALLKLPTKKGARARFKNPGAIHLLAKAPDFLYNNVQI